MAPLRSFIAALFLLAPVYASEELPSFVITDSQRASNHSLLWGPYRPQVYFGVKPRLPKSITTGLMWSRVDGFQYPSKSSSLYFTLECFSLTWYQRSDIL